MTCNLSPGQKNYSGFFEMTNHKPIQIISARLATSLLLTFAGICLLGGCASNNELTEDDFGNSVHQMITMQTANPHGRSQGLDGQKATLILQKYRKDVAEPKEVDRKALGTQTAKAAAAE